jgi:uncharacterized membrane protein
MRRSNKRALTVSLIVIGVVMLVLGGVMLATFPWQQGALPFAHMWAQGQGAAPDSSQGWPGNWYGYHHGWFMFGPRFFGGGLLIVVLVILAISFIARRAWYWRSGRYGGYDGPDQGLSAEEILRRKFAEGGISEEEYKSRLSALRK